MRRPGASGWRYGIGEIALSAANNSPRAQLLKFERELIPWYCPRCDAMYGDRRWQVWDVFDEDGWHEEIRGRCPNSHERMLED